MGRKRRILSGSHSELLDRTEAALRRRIEELDAKPSTWQKWIGSAEGDAEYHRGVLLEQFVRVMRGWSSGRMAMEAISTATIGPDRADTLVRDSRLLAEIESFAPALVTGPLNAGRQQWTTTGMSTWNGDPPSRRCFVAPSVDLPVTVQPNRFGIWTSTAAIAETSMWRAYLEPSRNRGGYPAPWHTWALAIDMGVDVIEIVSAAKWVDLVCSYPRVFKDNLYPDWAKIAQDFDGVHVTLSAVAAVQGFNFETPLGLIPPTFWDVDSTLWLRWRVFGSRLVEKIGHRPSEPA